MEFSADSLNVRYRGGASAVREFDLEFSGRVLTVFGKSCDGKTSLINALAGVTGYTGNAFLDGVELSKLEKGDVFALLEDCSLINKLTVYENLAFPLRLRGFDKIETAKRVNRAVEEYEFFKYVSVKAKDLSKRIRPYVGMAKITLTDRKLYLIDDILRPLPEEERAVCFKKLSREIRKLDGLVIYATSDIREALTLGDKTVVLYGGVIEQYGPREEITAKPLSVRIAKLVSSAPFEVEAAVLKKDGCLKIDYRGQEIPLPEETEKRLIGDYVGEVVQIGEFMCGDRREYLLFDVETDFTILKY